MDRPLPLRLIDWTPATDAPALPASPLAWLADLGQATAIHISGRDRGRCRVVSTLLHGNEPSGLVALHRWLGAAVPPATDVLAIVSAVEAARAGAGFQDRFLPGRRDLNRAFVGPADQDHDHDHALARAILDAIDRAATRAPIEAVVDLHNNSGHNPPYGVLTTIDPARLNLVALWAPRCVHYDLSLGTFMEATAHLPSITVECGQAGDPSADEIALAGLRRFLQQDDLGLAHSPPPIACFRHPIRVELAPAITVAFATAPAPGADLTLLPEVETHNFREVPAGTLLGWVAADAPWPLRAVDGADHDISRRCFEIRDGALRTRVATIPIMMTTSPRIAASDCLCYLVSRA